MDNLHDSRCCGAEETLRGVSMRALLTVAVVVFAVSSAVLLAAGAFLVAGA
jgi:hypothetical protein